MNSGLTSLLVLLLLIGMAGDVRADIYYRVEADGTISFTDQPMTRSYRRYLRQATRRVAVQRDRSEDRYDTIIRQAAERHRVDPALVKAVIKAESAFREDAVSPKGAMGLMQLMPQTAEAAGVRDPFEPSENILGGTRHLAGLLQRWPDDLDSALAAYNCGVACADRMATRGLPAETVAYVERVTRLYREYAAEKLAAEPAGAVPPEAGRLD